MKNFLKPTKITWIVFGGLLVLVLVYGLLVLYASDMIQDNTMFNLLQDLLTPLSYVALMVSNIVWMLQYIGLPVFENLCSPLLPVSAAAAQCSKVPTVLNGVLTLVLTLLITYVLIQCAIWLLSKINMSKKPMKLES